MGIFTHPYFGKTRKIEELHPSFLVFRLVTRTSFRLKFNPYFLFREFLFAHGTDSWRDWPHQRVRYVKQYESLFTNFIKKCISDKYIIKMEYNTKHTRW